MVDEDVEGIRRNREWCVDVMRWIRNKLFLVLEDVVSGVWIRKMIGERVVGVVKVLGSE